MPETKKMADISLRMPEEDVKYILESSRKYGYSPGAIVHEIIHEHIRRKEKEKAKL